jgi:branched-chain amino acid transport system ATP-binding protein
MLTVRDLNVHYGKIHAVRGVSFRVEGGEIVSIVGANGAGKSTLMWTLTGVLRPTSGSVEFDGRPLPARPHDIVRSGLALVPERRRLFADLTVRENLVMGAYLRRDAGVEGDMERMFSLFPILKARLAQFAGTLSGGEQQMLAIARAMMSAPRMILFDEPSLGLAPIVVDQLMETVRQVRDEGVTVLLVEQNAGRALEISDRAYVLEVGAFVAEGTGRELLADPAVRKAYLGDLG